MQIDTICMNNYCSYYNYQHNYYIVNYLTFFRSSIAINFENVRLLLSFMKGGGGGGGGCLNYNSKMTITVVIITKGTISIKW